MKKKVMPNRDKTAEFTIATWRQSSWSESALSLLWNVESTLFFFFFNPTSAICYHLFCNGIVV